MTDIKTKYKIVFGVLGTILLGALGSGLWNAILGPLLSLSANFFLTVFSLGIKAIKNNIYMDIAKGLHEQASLSWLMTFSCFMVALPITFVVISFFVIPYSKRWKEKIEQADNKQNELKKIVTILSCLLLFCTSSFLIEAIFVSYKISAVAHFQQSIAIVSPYIDTQNEEELFSKFAQIKSNVDYDSLISELDEIAIKNGKKLPVFDSW